MYDYTEEFGCMYCWDKRKKKDKDIYFFDTANNMRISNYCPYCGRKFGTKPDEHEGGNEDE